jgi:hypothetical protein
MSDRIGVAVDGHIVGTVPAFPNGVGDMVKSEIYAGLKGRVRAEIRMGDVILLRADSVKIARSLPGFNAA